MNTVPKSTRRENIRGVVPFMVEFTETVLFPQIWERPQLSKRDRSIITLAACVSTYRPEQLKSHIGRALDHGVTREEIGELITHLAFYAGWPAASSAAHIAHSVFTARDNAEN